MWQNVVFLSSVSEGSKTIILTILIAGVASALFPHEEEEHES